MSTNAKKIRFAYVALVVLLFSGSLLTPELQIAAKQMAIKQSVQRNYVVFSTTLEEFARQSDYNYLPPVTALNWYVTAGFHPIIFIVTSSLELFQKVSKLWEILLPPQVISKSGHIIPLIVLPNMSAVLVAQVARLYGASWLSTEDISDESFLRLTDVDMLIYESAPFLPPPPNIDIDIYNGGCCRGRGTQVGDRICYQYPMHSVGMKAKLWRTLFPLHNVSFDVNGQNLIAHIISVAESFGYKVGEKINHGGQSWYFDQTLLGCTIDAAVGDNNELTYHLSLSQYPGSERLHVGEQFRNNSYYIDAHLANFQLDRHHQWLGQLVHETAALSGYQEAYDHYFQAWTREKPKMFLSSQ